MTTTPTGKSTVQQYIDVIHDYRAGKFGEWLTVKQIFKKAKRLDILDNLTEADVDELLRLKYETGMSAYYLKLKIREREAKKAAAKKE